MPRFSKGLSSTLIGEEEKEDFHMAFLTKEENVNLITEFNNQNHTPRKKKLNYENNNKCRHHALWEHLSFNAIRPCNTFWILNDRRIQIARIISSPVPRALH